MNNPHDVQTIPESHPPARRPPGVRSLAATLGLGSMLAAAACVQSPENDQWVAPWEVDFAGYAENPNAVIEIEARDKHTGAWITIATTNAAASPTSWDGGTTELYPWSLTNVDTLATGECIWGNPAWVNCPINAGSAHAEFRVREPGGSLGTLMTFDSGGVSCVVNELVAGTDWLNAGFTCRSSDTPIITLHWLT